LLSDQLQWELFKIENEARDRCTRIHFPCDWCSDFGKLFDPRLCTRFRECFTEDENELVHCMFRFPEDLIKSRKKREEESARRRALIEQYHVRMWIGKNEQGSHVIFIQGDPGWEKLGLYDFSNGE